jgi:hypothetical protein
VLHFPTLLALAGVFALGSAGCDRRLEPWVDAAEEPPPTEQPVRVPGLGRPVPAPFAQAAPAPLAGSEAGIRGVIRLPADAASEPGEGVLFVIARSAGGGPPLAAKRLQPGPFPLRFEIGPADAMLAERPFIGPILLSARVDFDGDPLTRSPEDWTASAPGPLDPGATDVELVLQPAR